MLILSRNNCVKCIRHFEEKLASQLETYPDLKLYVIAGELNVGTIGRLMKKYEFDYQDMLINRDFNFIRRTAMDRLPALLLIDRELNKMNYFKL